MTQSFESLDERVNLSALVDFSYTNKKVVRAFGEVAREREAARDVVLGGQTAQQSVRFDRRAHDELVEDVRGVGEREAFDRGDLTARVGGLLRALRGDLLKTSAAHRRHVDGRGERDQTFVGADVRGSLLAPYVLLARGEREDEAAAALSVVCDAGEPARHLARVLLARGEQPDVRAAEGDGHAERLPLRDDDVGAARARRAKHSERRALRADDAEQRSRRVNLVGESFQVFDAAEEVWRLDDDRGHGLVERGFVKVERRAPRLFV